MIDNDVRQQPPVAERSVVDSETNIFDSPLYRVDYFPADRPAEAVAITFTPRGNQSLAGMGYGKGFMLKSGYALIAVKSSEDRWYQDLPDEALQAILTFLESSGLSALPRATYGSSMGAYAAITFAGPLKADALALSPPSDIKQPWDPRWRDDTPLFRPITPDPGRNGRIVIVYDPYDLDGRHARAIGRAFPHCVHIQVPFSGHSAAEALQHMGCLRPLALAVIAGKVLPNIAPIIREKQKAGEHYIFVLANHCRDRRKPRWGYQLVTRAVAANPLNAEYRILASVLAVDNGQPIEAIEHAAVAASIDPRHHGMQYHLAELLRRAGHTAAALAVAKRALTLQPNLAAYIEQCRGLEEALEAARAH